nr:amino acid permease 3-like [Tanacetum cinerariifolium]GFA47153.1 amino acid permease 3-like [Tanacetum cinerariifolium]
MGQEMTTGELEIARFAPQAPSKFFDDDGRLKRSGTVWTASAHIITAVIGSGVLSLAWAMAQLGWIAGPTVLFLFSFVTYYTSCLLADCYQCGDPVTGKRNYTYMEAVKNNFCAIKRSSCLHEKGHDNPCRVSGTPYILMFGIVEIIFSQIPDFDQISWLSMLSASMSFTYSTIGIGLGISKVVENGKIEGSLTGISVRKVTLTQKIWRSSQALGAIAFAYSYSLDTIKSQPAEHKTMKKTSISVATTTVFYMFCGCFGYAAPGNILTGFGFYNPYWLIDIANGAIVIHLIGAYQVICQPLFAFVENIATRYFPESKFINENIEIPIPFGGYQPYKPNMFRLLWRTAFICMTTFVAMLMPFFNDVVGIIGAFGFWPLTVYFPVKMYIAQKKIQKWST